MPPRRAVLGMDNASFFYGAGRIFAGVSFLLDSARTAPVGENGAGKSTLLKCLTGELELNDGQVIRSRGLRLGSVPQDIPDELAALLLRQVLGRSLERAGHGGEDWRIDVLLDEVGLAPEAAEQPFGRVSGGWQRLMLIAAAARLEEPDLLALDEPTNHLDIEGQEALEAQLEETQVSCIFVSHDRYFTRTAATRFLEIRRGRLVEADDADAFFEAQH